MATFDDSFNAFASLSRLRGEKPINSSPAPVNDTSRDKSSFIPSNTTPSPRQSKFVTTNQHNPSLVVNKISTVSFLTPSERKEHLEVRAELDKEIRRLQDELSKNKSEKKSLQQENQRLRDEISTIKSKYDERIAKLRDKIAKMSSHMDELNALNEKRAQVFSAMGIMGMAAQMDPSKKKVKGQGGRIASPSRVSYSSTGGMNPRLGPSNPPPQTSPAPNTIKLANGYVQSLPFSFAEPTFSELMRRSTPDHDDFIRSLRKPAGLGKPPIIPGPLEGYDPMRLSSPPPMTSSGEYQDENGAYNYQGSDQPGRGMYLDDFGNDDDDDDDDAVLDIDLRP